MTPSPESRAEKLAVQLLGRAMNSPAAISLIADAIREAERDIGKRLTDPFRAMDFHQRLIPKDVLDIMFEAVRAQHKD